MQTQTYLYFEGRCAEAVEFYRKTLGAEVTAMMRAKDSPDAAMCPAGAQPDSVIHASFRIGDATLMASDGRNSGQATFQGFAIALSVPKTAEAERLFAALQAGGGQAQMPLQKTFFSPAFGMVADRFGVSWMIVVG